MRLQLSKSIQEDDYFLHADMWNINNFPINANVINTGLGESNLLNIAGGIASQGNTVYIYGVCGFIIHRFEQLKFSCKHFGAKKGKIIICNAGQYGYEGLGIGHKLDDDEAICSTLDIPLYKPSTVQDIKFLLKEISLEDNGIFYIRLGKDQ